ncbi:MAG: hypothetical protein FWB72_03920 [Firmicutes bacterium]|nr:hypothetical protein [Bacillota bacterium]
MKKITIFVLSFGLLLCSVLALPFSTNLTASASVSEEYKKQQLDKEVITISVAPLFQDNPYETIRSGVYGEGGRRLFVLRETGMVITEDGVPFENPVDSTVVEFDSETESFIDGANRSLAIVLDSRLERHYLRAGGRYVRPIRLDDSVVLITLNARGGQRRIYAFYTRYDRGWLAGVLSGHRHGYRFYDMNRRHIHNDYIAEFVSPSWWRINVLTVITGNHKIPLVRILERTTLANLLVRISHATVHPWDRLKCGLTGFDVITEDGRDIFVNPRTRQLTDFAGWALFNENTGLPIVWYNYDIITTDRRPQRIENGVLRESITVWGLLESRVDFYIGSISTTFGQFDVPKFRVNTDPNNPDWQLINGDCANDIVDDSRPSEVLDGESFATWLGRQTNRVGGSANNFFSGLSNIISVAGFVLVIFVALMLVGAVREAASPKRREDR